MGAKMEVLPNSLSKRRGSSTVTWGGGTLGRVGGRRRKRAPRLVGHLPQQHLTQVYYNNIMQCSLWSAFFIAASHTGLLQQHHAVQPVVGLLHSSISRSAACGRPSSTAASHTVGEVSSILAMTSRPAPCGSPAATIASAMRGSSASPGSLTGCKVMEEFLDSAWRGQRTTEERETMGERRRTPRGRSPILLPLDLVKLHHEKVRV